MFIKGHIQSSPTEYRADITITQNPPKEPDPVTTQQELRADAAERILDLAAALRPEGHPNDRAKAAITAVDAITDYIMSHVQNLQKLPPRPPAA